MWLFVGDDSTSKRERMLELLTIGKVMLHLDPRCQGVDAPDEFDGDPVLRLDYSYRMRIPDLELSDDGVRATLSFRGKPQLVNVPWHSVFAITSHVRPVGFVWPEQLPDEMREEFEAMEADGSLGAAPPPDGLAGEDAGDDDDERFTGPALTVIEGEGEGAEQSPRPPPPLKLVNDDD